jgi:hypothetical protein
MNRIGWLWVVKADQGTGLADYLNWQQFTHIFQAPEEYYPHQA